MDRIIYIDPKTQAGLKSISELSNSETFLKYLDPVDYNFVLYASLYQSGTNYFELDLYILPDSIKTNPFWKDKFISSNKKVYQASEDKAIKILANNFDFELDKTYNGPQASNLKEYLTSLFYSAETGIPFVNAEYAESKNFDFLEPRFNKEFFLALKKFHSLIALDTVSTITPQYSVLKKDVKRFEEIANSALYSKYSDSLNLLREDNKIDLIKKDIHSNALKVYSKYAKHLDLKAMTFSFLKANKKVADLFVNKQTSAFGDFIIDTIEKISSGKRKVNYYKVEEAHYMILWANRIGEMMQKGGKETLKEFLDERKKKNSH